MKYIYVTFGDWISDFSGSQRVIQHLTQSPPPLPHSRLKFTKGNLFNLFVFAHIVLQVRKTQILEKILTHSRLKFTRANLGLEMQVGLNRLGP